jgi:hypothetical protein
MPKVKISEFSSTPGNNTDINSINIAEGCAPSGINDAIRTLMAYLKDWQGGAVAQDNSFNGAVTVSGATVLSSTLAVTGATTVSGAAVMSSTLAVTGNQTNSGNLTVSGGTTFTGASVMSSDLNVAGKTTLTGSSSKAALTIPNALEDITVSATAATGTIAYDVTTQSVLYYTSNASANWTVNFRGSSGTSLNTLMATGESITATFLVTQGSTAYYNNTVQIDGSSVTPKYQGGTAWTAGNASSIDAYTYTIVKTGSATFTVFASQTKFA